MSAPISEALRNALAEAYAAGYQVGLDDDTTGRATPGGSPHDPVDIYRLADDYVDSMDWLPNTPVGKESYNVSEL